MVNSKFLIDFFKKEKIFFYSFRAIYLVIFSLSCRDHTHVDKKIFRYNETSGIASLDPAFAKNQSIMWAIHQLYNTLIEVDSNMQLKPSLASSWEFTDSNKTVTFHLRNDVYFQDDECFTNNKGRILVAADVAYSFDRIIDKNTASPGSWIFNNRVAENNPFIALNDSTFQIKLRAPFQPILGI